VATVTAALTLERLTFGYGHADEQVLTRVSLCFEAGEFALICGPTGSGKSTLLKCINGLAPGFTGGVLGGKIVIHGVDRTGSSAAALAGEVGFVNQQPEAGFVAQTVREELAFGMEQLGVSVDDMQTRIFDMAEKLRLTPLLDRDVQNLSGGEQQRVAIAAAIAAGQRILLLDEPTSALDAQAATETIQLLRRIATELGITILLTEHHIERVLEFVDSVTVVFGDGSATKTKVAEVGKELFRDYRMLPPFIELGKRIGWEPLPLSIGEATSRWRGKPPNWQPLEAPAVGESVFEAHSITIEYKVKRQAPVLAVRGMKLSLNAGEIVGLMGGNGSGKSSLLWRIQEMTAAAMVPQRASDLLFLPSVSKEFAEADRLSQVERGTTAQIIERLVGRIDPAIHPRDLSAGRQLALALAVQLTKNSRLILLDEPTRGLDYSAKEQLAHILRDLAAEGRAILIASHDVEFLASLCSRVVTLKAGSMVSSLTASDQFGCDGPTPSELAQISHEPDLITIAQIEVDR
jgi:energy-coupling factor transport system ATP-binding protein